MDKQWWDCWAKPYLKPSDFKDNTSPIHPIIYSPLLEPENRQIIVQGLAFLGQISNVLSKGVESFFPPSSAGPKREPESIIFLKSHTIKPIRDLPDEEWDHLFSIYGKAFEAMHWNKETIRSAYVSWQSFVQTQLELDQFDTPSGIAGLDLLHGRNAYAVTEKISINLDHLIQAIVTPHKATIEPSTVYFTLGIFEEINTAFEGDLKSSLYEQAMEHDLVRWSRWANRGTAIESNLAKIKNALKQAQENYFFQDDLSLARRPV